MFKQKTFTFRIVLLASLFLFGGIIITAPPTAIALPSNTPNLDFPQVNTDGTVYAIEIADDGSMYIGGDFTEVGGQPRFGMAKILPDNTVDPDFNPDTNAAVWTIEIDGDTIYAGGDFTTVNGGTVRRRAAAFNADTGIATAFDPKIPTGSVADIVIDEQAGIVYVGGSFSRVNSNSSFSGGVIRSSLAAFTEANGTVTSFNPDMDGQATALALSGSVIYATGYFSTFAGAPQQGIVGINTGTGNATSFNPDINGTVTGVLLTTENTLYISGAFTTVNGGTPRDHIAEIDLGTGLATDFNPSIGGNFMGGYGLALDQERQILYIGGEFTESEAGNKNLVGVKVGDGSVIDFQPNPSRPDFSFVYDVAFDDSARRLYAGGLFTSVQGVERNGIATFAELDEDADGIDDSVENTAPNSGDANNDGTPDAEQANVTSLLNDETGEYVTVVTPSGTILETTTAESAPNEDGFTHLFGLTGFTVSGVTPGASIDIEIFYPKPDNLSPADLIPKKYFPSTTAYQDLEGAIVTNETIDSQPTLKLSYSLTDGGEYDLDGVSDGEITDPVSLAQAMTDSGNGSSEAEDNEESALAETGHNQSLLLIASAGLLTLAAISMRRQELI